MYDVIGRVCVGEKGMFWVLTDVRKEVKVVRRRSVVHK